MRELFPRSVEPVDPGRLYDDRRRLEAGERPYVYVNMVASVDGATVVDGVSEQLGGEGDRQIFVLLRSMADAILVGAGTARAEGYGPPRVREEFAADRVARNQAPAPRIAVVSNSLELDWTSKLFSDPDNRPLILTGEDAPAERREQAMRVADLVTTPGARVDLAAALPQLRSHGIRALLCEGGPTLNAALVAAGLVDELCLSVAPCLVGSQGGKRIIGGDLPDVAGLQLAHVLEQDGALFLRYLVSASRFSASSPS